jgi:hypothetical protein
MKKYMYFLILNYRPPIFINVFFKKLQLVEPYIFWGFIWNEMEVTSVAWTQCGRLDNPPKSVFKHAFIIIILWMLKICRNIEI